MEKLNLVEILKDVPKGTKLYSPIYGKCEIYEINCQVPLPIVVIKKDTEKLHFTSDGKIGRDGECLLFPSKENRDWSTFKVEPEFPTNLIDSEYIINENTDGEFAYYVALNSKMDCLRQLIIHRDAWWKVDNDWKPDWNLSENKHIICSIGDKATKDVSQYKTRLLAFRTAGIRDKFLETFRCLIEECKELI